MREHTRNCPKCGKELHYKCKNSYEVSRKNKKTCKSCSIKRLYELDPEKNKGERNGRTGKKTIDVFVEKYGVDEGTIRYKDLTKKLGEHGFKSGSENPSFGKVPNNSGWSYKGWYKGLFFRSSLELLFIMDFEDRNGRLVLSAESTFRMKYEEGSRTYCPDFFDPVTNTIFEIKAKRFLPENFAKFEAAKEFVKEKNLSFKIVTESDVGYIESRIVWMLRDFHLSGQIKLTECSLKKLNDRIEKMNNSVNEYKRKKKCVNLK